MGNINKAMVAFDLSMSVLIHVLFLGIRKTLKIPHLWVFLKRKSNFSTEQINSLYSILAKLLFPIQCRKSEEELMKYL